MVSSLGVGSGLPLQNLVEQLVTLEGRGETIRIATKEKSLNNTLQALNDLKSAISDFHSVIGDLGHIDQFRQRSVTVEDTNILTAQASSTAANANYEIEVKALAQSHKIKSDAFSNVDTVLGTGTLTFEFGTFNGVTFTNNPDRSTKTLAIDTAHQTLEGIQEAINNDNTLGVSASIVNDGTGYRLVLTSAESGTDNSLKVTISGDSSGTDIDNNGLSQLAYDPTATAGAGKNMTDTVAAADASVDIDGILVSSSSNVLTDAIQNVTLTLNKADVGNKIQVAVNVDKDSVRSKIDSFINSYNNVFQATVSDLGKYDPDGAHTGALIGDFTLRSIENQVKTIITSQISNLTGPFKSLAEIGVKTTSSGTLEKDAAVLEDALNNHFDDIMRVFAAYAEPSDIQVEFVTSTDDTKTGSYVLDVSQLATQGNLAGSAAANLTITAGVNDTLELIIDGINANITLEAKTYPSASELATAIQTRINGVSQIEQQGATVNVSESGGVLTVTSDQYGSSSEITLSGGTGATDVFGATPTSTTGVDVAGSLNGTAFTGNGQVFTGNGDSKGLSMKITGGTTGHRGFVDFARGIGAQLIDTLDSILASSSGISERINSLNDQLQDLQDDKIALNDRLEKYRLTLIKQFSALDTTISGFNSQGDYLNQQFDLMKNIAKQAAGR